MNCLSNFESFGAVGKLLVYAKGGHAPGVPLNRSVTDIFMIFMLYIVMCQWVGVPRNFTPGDKGHGNTMSGRFRTATYGGHKTRKKVNPMCLCTPSDDTQIP